MIFTFYSFKGGVGRSMALANVAELFAQRGLKVLMIDFDLEAPGLERYFASSEAMNQPEDVLKHRGVIDLLISYIKLRGLPLPRKTGIEAMVAAPDHVLFPYPVEPLTNFIVPIYDDRPGCGTLSIIPAGCRYSDEFTRYAEQVRSFDWDHFFTTLNGEQFFEWFRSEVETIADVILIDSRTGVTEMSGVCTYQLADVVVMFTASNQQSLDGTQMMARSLTNPRLVAEGRNGRPLSLLFVPSRVEHGEARLLDEFANDFQNLLGAFIPTQLQFKQTMFIDLKIPYVPFYAYRENVATRESDRASAADMMKSFINISRTLAQLAPQDSPIHSAFSDLAENLPLRTQGDVVMGDVHIYQNADDESAGELLLAPYLRSLARICSQIPLAYADSSDPTRATADLSAIFTDLEVGRTVKETRDGREQTRQQTALESLALHPRLVLLGPPGSGKSTIANYVALRLAQSRLVGAEALHDYLGTAWTHGALLPIRVVLRELATWLSARPLVLGSVELLWAFLSDQERFSGALVYRLRRDVAAGQALLILDGLDDVPAGDDGHLLGCVQEIIRDLAAVADRSRILVTCRELDYRTPQARDHRLAQRGDHRALARTTRRLCGSLVCRVHPAWPIAERRSNGAARPPGWRDPVSPRVEPPSQQPAAAHHDEPGACLRWPPARRAGEAL